MTLAGVAQSVKDQGKEHETKEKGKPRWVGAYLEQGMTSDNTQEPLQALSSCLNNFIGEAVRENLSGQRGDVDAGGFVF